jgi:hypothetical protein
MRNESFIHTAIKLKASVVGSGSLRAHCAQTQRDESCLSKKSWPLPAEGGYSGFGFIANPVRLHLRHVPITQKGKTSSTDQGGFLYIQASPGNSSELSNLPSEVYWRSRNSGRYQILLHCTARWRRWYDAGFGWVARRIFASTITFFHWCACLRVGHWRRNDVVSICRWWSVSTNPVCCAEAQQLYRKATISW